MSLKIFNLQCDNGHIFEGWFKSVEDYDQQLEAKILICPICNSQVIKKLLSFPHVANSIQEKNTKNIHKYIKDLINKAEHVGNNFAEEAKKIHLGITKPRSITGYASHEEIKTLKEDGINTITIPDYLNDKKILQ